MTMIDLGEVNQAPEQVIPVDHRRIRRAVLAAATVVGLLLVGGSARSAPPFGLRPLWSTAMTGDDQPLFGPDTGYLLRGTELTAYELADGSVRWTARIPRAPYPPEPAGEVVLLRSDPITVEQREANGISHTFEFARSTRALSARTGAELWRINGEPTVVGGGTALFEEHNGRGDVIRLRLTRLADGATIWARATPGTWTSTEGTDRDPAKLITMDPTGKINIFRYADGAPLGGGRLPAIKSAEVGLSGTGSLLAVVRQDPDGRATTVLHRLDDLTRLWQTDSDYGINACGPVLCTRDERGLVGHDPATGRELWRQPGMRTAWPVGPERLLLDDGAEDDPTYRLIDAATGQQLGAAIRGHVLETATPAGSMLVLRRTTQPDGLTSVTRLDLTTGAQTLLGALSPVVETSCRSLGRYLACPRDGRLDVLAVARR